MSSGAASSWAPRVTAIASPRSVAAPLAVFVAAVCFSCGARTSLDDAASPELDSGAPDDATSDDQRAERGTSNPGRDAATESVATEDASPVAACLSSTEPYVLSFEVRGGGFGASNNVPYTLTSADARITTSADYPFGSQAEVNAFVGDQAWDVRVSALDHSTLEPGTYHGPLNYPLSLDMEFANRQCDVDINAFNTLVIDAVQLEPYDDAGDGLGSVSVLNISFDVQCRGFGPLEDNDRRVRGCLSYRKP